MAQQGGCLVKIILGLQKRGRRDDHGRGKSNRTAACGKLQTREAAVKGVPELRERGRCSLKVKKRGGENQL